MVSEAEHEVTIVGLNADADNGQRPAEESQRSGARRVREYAITTQRRAERFVVDQRAKRSWLDVGGCLYERDREMDGSVLASAVALRIFLFFIPLLLVLVGTLGFVSNHLSTTDASKQLGVTGGLATQINSALHQSSRARWIALGSGLFGAAFAGRNLARALTTAARRAWRLDTAQASTKTMRLAGAVTGMITSAGLLAIIVNRLRQAAGLVGGSLAVATAAVAYSAVWFLVCLAIPRGRADRTSLLPGAVFAGVGLAVTQWVLQFELSGQLNRASQLYGSIGTVVVALSWFFIAGRLFVASFAVDAVVWERFGSLASWFLGWGRLARFVEGHPGIGRFLELGGSRAAITAGPPSSGEAKRPARHEHGDDGTRDRGAPDGERAS